MRHWTWITALLTLVLLAACQPITPPAGGTVPPTPEGSATEEPTGELPAGLVGVTWEWQSTQTADGSEVTVAEPSRYTLTFREDGNVDVQFDCNSGGGPYTVEGDQLTFGAMITTLMGCPEDSQADVFADGLNTAATCAREGNTLTLGLADGGAMVFRAAGTGNATASLWRKW